MRRFGMLLGVITLALTGVACDPEGTGQAHQDKGVIVFSDSVWDWSMGPVHRKWMENGIMVVDSTHEGWGWTLTGGVNVANQTTQQEWADRVASSFDLLDLTEDIEAVVNLGINDCNKLGGNLSSYQANITNFLSAVPASVQVNFVTVRPMPGQPNCAESINSMWQAALANRGNAEIWPYAEHFNSSAHPEWFIDNEHLSTAGANELATWSLGLLQD